MYLIFNINIINFLLFNKCGLNINAIFLIFFFAFHTGMDVFQLLDKNLLRRSYIGAG